MLKEGKALRSAVASSAILIFGLTFLGYVVGFLAQVITAKFFGVSKDLDAFIAAAVIPDFIFGITNTIFMTAFVVTYPEYIRKKGEKKGKEYICKLFTLLIILLLLCILLLLFFAPVLAKFIGPGFSGVQTDLTISIIRILSVSVFFLGLISLASGILYHEHKFFAPKALRIMLGVCSIIAILLLGKKLEVSSLAAGTVMGTIIAFLFAYAAILKQKYSFSFLFPSKDKFLNKILILSWPLLIAGSIYYANKVFINMVASGLGHGAISIVNYAFIVSNAPVIFFSESVATAIFPHLAKQAANEKKEELKQLATKSIQILLVILIPITFIFMILNTEIIQLFFQRGEFTKFSTCAVSKTLFLFSVGIVPAGIFTLLLHIFYVKKRMSAQMYLFALFFILNVLLIRMFVKFMSYEGIALGRSVSFWCVMIIALAYIGKKIGGFGYASLVKTIAKIIPATVIMGIFIFLLKNIANTIIGFLAVIVLAVVIYAVILRCMRSEEIMLIEQALKEKIKW